MSREELQNALDSLQSEIDRLDSTDHAVKERLTHLIADVEHELDQPETRTDDTVAQETIANLIEQFEMEHPRITETLNRIMVALGSMGI